MRNITLFDTSISSDNLGDGIIMDAVRRHLKEIYPPDNFVSVPTHIPLTSAQRGSIKNNDMAFVGGTNLLCAYWLLKPQWKIGIIEALTLPNPILMGVGWRFYQRPTDIATKIFLRKLLSKKYIHSVRDSYTEERLKKINIHNVINTACPTMWQLTPEHCDSIPTERSASVMTTVTAYHHNPELDRKWLEVLTNNYEKVYLWPQMSGDDEYVKNMNLGDKIEILEPSLAAYDNALETLDVDFLGTRLHGGIRAMQNKRRTLIIEVDNRAAEIARDTGLPTVKRDDTQKMLSWINGEVTTKLTLPWENINRWKSQFK
ncbi:MAG: polysaccharide pyruvyl transferase family protein [Rickettsiales bacterium]